MKFEKKLKRKYFPQFLFSFSKKINSFFNSNVFKYLNPVKTLCLPGVETFINDKKNMKKGIFVCSKIFKMRSFSSFLLKLAEILEIQIIYF